MTFHLHIAAMVFAGAEGGQPVADHGKEQDATVDQQAIKQVLSTYAETWNRHDMKAWGELFTDDVDYVNRAGGIWHGNKANVEGTRRSTRR